MVLLIAGCVSHNAPDGKTVLNPPTGSNESSNESEALNLSAPILDFESFIGSDNEDCAYSVVKLNDGFLLAGYTTDGSNERAYVVRTNSRGGVLWNNSFIFYQDKETSEFWDAVNTSDGGFLLVGEVWVNDTNPDDFLIVKVNSSGDEVWSVNYGGDVSQEQARGVVQSSDGGFIITGYTNGHGAGEEIWETIIYTVKVDSNGGLVWEKSFNPSEESSTSWSVTRTSDDGFIIVGDALYYYDETSGYDAYVMKINSLGELVWDYAFDSGGSETAVNAIESSDGGFVIVGDSERDALFFKLNSSGSLEWSNTIGGDYSDKAWGVVEVSDGFVMTGVDSYSVSGVDALLFKTDFDGNVLWNSTYGGGSADYAYSLIKDGDGFVLSGRSTQGPGMFNFWLARIE